jgi:hypothetical protein
VTAATAAALTPTVAATRLDDESDAAMDNDDADRVGGAAPVAAANAVSDRSSNFSMVTVVGFGVSVVAVGTVAVGDVETVFVVEVLSEQERLRSSTKLVLLLMLLLPSPILLILFSG